MTPAERELKALAEKATPGPWYAHYVYKGHDARLGIMIGATHPGHQLRTEHRGGTYPGPDLDYIAACSPERILALLARVEKLEAALRHVSASADTLSPQEFINVCADALGVDRHEYSGEAAANRSIIEYRIALKRIVGGYPTVVGPDPNTWSSAAKIAHAALVDAEGK